ncbi:MAG: hypothetical protein CL793_00570 [Chloroflexi bacterium]|nr:hypothetical protein [Chloroflexota bacterium]
MLNLLHEFKEWVVGFSDSPWAVFALAINSFTESIFNPIPSDPLILGMAAINPGSVFWLALVATVASVAGAVVGWMGGIFFGRRVLLKIVSAEKSYQVENLFGRYGIWVVLIAAFTPIPYKVFAITAGMLRFDLRSFIVVSLIGRGARFFLLAGVLYYLGNSGLLDRMAANFTLLTVAIVALGVAAVGVLVLAKKALGKR